MDRGISERGKERRRDREREKGEEEEERCMCVSFLHLERPSGFNF